MNPKTLQTFKSPRWLVLFASFLMMAVGYAGAQGFEYVSHLRHEKFGDDDVFAILFAMVGFAGMVLFVICCLWILLTALFRQKHPKKV